MLQRFVTRLKRLKEPRVSPGSIPKIRVDPDVSRSAPSLKYCDFAVSHAEEFVPRGEIFSSENLWTEILRDESTDFLPPVILPSSPSSSVTNARNKSRRARVSENRFSRRICLPDNQDNHGRILYSYNFIASRFLEPG